MQDGATLARHNESAAAAKGRACRKGEAKVRGRCVSTAPVTVGAIGLRISTAGTYRLKVRVTNKTVQAALKKGKRLSLKVTLSFTPSGSHTTTKVVSTVKVARQG